MNIDHDVKLDFDDVLLVPQRSKAASRQQVNLIRNFKFYHSSRKWSGVPVMAANMDTTGTFEMSKCLQDHSIITCINKHYSLDDRVANFKQPQHTWYSLGIKDKDLDELFDFIDSTSIVPNLCIDVANGYTDDFVSFCSLIRKEFNNLGSDYSPIIMAGNVCSPEMVQEIILHGGVDIVKIGIGPGSAADTHNCLVLASALMLPTA